MKKRVMTDVNKILQAHQATKGQEAPSGGAFGASDDMENFPVFKMPVGEKILVYIPKSMTVVNEDNEEVFEPVTNLSHFVSNKQKKMFGTFRCVHGLQGAAFDELGYDGNCPFCNASNTAWEGFNLEVELEAKKRGLDPRSEEMKSIRSDIYKKMVVGGAEEYVTFPVVVIPTKAEGKKILLTDDFATTSKVYYVTWKKSVYEKRLSPQLENSDLESPDGLFWAWSFTVPEGTSKELEAQVAGRDATFVILPEKKQTEFAEAIPVLEELAADFTAINAVQYLLAHQYLDREFMEFTSERVIDSTKRFIDSMSLIGGGTGVKAPTASVGGSVMGALQDFGTAGGEDDDGFDQ